MRHQIITYILLLLGLAMSATMQAQVGDHRNDLSVGVTAGYTLNKMDFQPVIKQAMKGSPMLGVASRFICEKYFTCVCGVELEVLLQNLGWKEVIEDGSGNAYKRDLYFVEVPMLMQLGWGRERRGAKFFIEAGPQLGVYLGSKEHKEGNPWDDTHRPNNVNYQYGKDPDNTIDYGIAAGLGLEYSTPVGHFLLQGRYYYGLGDVYDNSKRGKFGRSANQTIQVKLTYLFDLIRTKNDRIK